MAERAEVEDPPLPVVEASAQQLLSIHYLRGVAAMMVVAYHIHSLGLLPTSHTFS